MKGAVMKSPKLLASNAAPAVILIRFIVGGVFLSEGVQKFLFPGDLGVGRFIKIGIPSPEVMAPFVGVVEIVGGVLLLAGFLTRLAAIPLIINMLVATGFSPEECVAAVHPFPAPCDPIAVRWKRINRSCIQAARACRLLAG
jgi:uncharacterized membrane protein